MKDLTVEATVKDTKVHGIVLGSAIQFGEGKRMLAKVRYTHARRNKLPVLLTRQVPQDFELTYFQKVGDSVKEVVLSEEITREVCRRFRTSFLFGRKSFSLCIF